MTPSATTGTRPVWRLPVLARPERRHLRALPPAGPASHPMVVASRRAVRHLQGRRVRRWPSPSPLAMPPRAGSSNPLFHAAPSAPAPGGAALTLIVQPEVNAMTHPTSPDRTAHELNTAEVHSPAPVPSAVVSAKPAPAAPPLWAGEPRGPHPARWGVAPATEGGGDLQDDDLSFLPPGDPEPAEKPGRLLLMARLLATLGKRVDDGSWLAPTAAGTLTAVATARRSSTPSSPRWTACATWRGWC